MTVYNDVYESLKASTGEMAPKVVELQRLEAMEHSGDYTEQRLQAIRKDKDSVRKHLSEAAVAAGKAARDIVNCYGSECERGTQLDPAKITDDIRLLDAPIELNRTDISAMLERNKGNATMTQIIVRYANSHGIDTRGMDIPNSHEWQKTVGDLDYIIGKYIYWIDRPGASEVLDKFFQSVIEQ